MPGLRNLRRLFMWHCDGNLAHLPGSQAFVVFDAQDSTGHCGSAEADLALLLFIYGASCRGTTVILHSPLDLLLNVCFNVKKSRSQCSFFYLFCFFEEKKSINVYMNKLLNELQQLLKHIWGFSFGTKAEILLCDCLIISHMAMSSFRFACVDSNSRTSVVLIRKRYIYS